MFRIADYNQALSLSSITFSLHVESPLTRSSRDLTKITVNKLSIILSPEEDILDAARLLAQRVYTTGTFLLVSMKLRTDGQTLVDHARVDFKHLPQDVCAPIPIRPDRAMPRLWQT